MAKLTIERPGRKPTLARVRKLEEQLGEKLPPDYKRFLLQYNGGRPEPGYFTYRGGQRQLLWVDFFYSLDANLARPSGASESDYNTIAFALFANGAIIPKGSLIIASVSRDDRLILFYRGRRRGKIYVKRLDELPFPPEGKSEKEPELGLHFVAPSFAHFLKKLRTDPDDPEE